MFKRHIILMLLSCLPLCAILFQLSDKAQNFQKDVNKYKIWVLVFSKTCLEKFKFQNKFKYIVLNYINIHVKCPLLLRDCNEI